MSGPTPAKIESIPALPGLLLVAHRHVIARFNGGQPSSASGVLALRAVERRLGVADPRAAERFVRTLADILRCRMLQQEAARIPRACSSNVTPDTLGARGARQALDGSGGESFSYYMFQILYTQS